MYNTIREETKKFNVGTILTIFIFIAIIAVGTAAGIGLANWVLK